MRPICLLILPLPIADAFTTQRLITTASSRHYVQFKKSKLFNQVFEQLDEVNLDTRSLHENLKFHKSQNNNPLNKQLAFTTTNFENEQSSINIPVTIDVDILSETIKAVETTNAVLKITRDASESSNILPTANSVSLQNDASTETASPLSNSNNLSAPTVMTIMKFAIPAIGVWLCNPILSLIDTSAVGILSGVTQQAALNPATAVTDYTALLMAFLYTGSTNLIAASRGKGEERTTKTFIGALQLSTYVGIVLGLMLIGFATPFLRAIIGNDGINPAVFDAAMKYVRIRALGMPAAAFIGTAQASCIGMQDVRSPLYVLLSAAVVNFVGDMLLVGNANPWIGGAAGAAWATVFSQYAAAALFVHWLCNKKTEKDKTQVLVNGDHFQSTESNVKQFANMIQKGGDGNNQGTSKPFSVRGFLQNKLRKRDLALFPPRSTLKEFSPYFIPVSSTVVGRVSGYVAMSHVVSSSFGTFSMAAQQVIVSVFYCLCPIADSLSLTAQSFVPALADTEISKERANNLLQTSWNFIKAGCAFGAVLVAAISLLPLLSGFFTSDQNVVSLVNAVTPLLIGFFSIHGLLCATEGILLGQKDLGFLGKMYTAFFFIVPYFMLRVKRAALSGAAVGLTTIWSVFALYQVFRVAAWVGRVAWLQNKTNKEAAALA